MVSIVYSSVLWWQKYSVNEVDDAIGDGDISVRDSSGVHHNFSVFNLYRYWFSINCWYISILKSFTVVSASYHVIQKHLSGKLWVAKDAVEDLSRYGLES